MRASIACVWQLSLDYSCGNPGFTAWVASVVLPFDALAGSVVHVRVISLREPLPALFDEAPCPWCFPVAISYNMLTMSFLVSLCRPTACFL